jgi:hypothetical protein
VPRPATVAIIRRERREAVPGASKMPPQTGSIPEESSRTERNR